MNAPYRTAPERLRLTVDDFLLLDESGAFADYTKTELIEGEIWAVNAQLSRHARIKTNLAVELTIRLRTLETRLRPIVEASTRVSHDSLPEPDIVVTDYKGARHVPLETVALIVEVSDTTLDIDLGRKLRLYASAGVAEYWVVDVEGERVIRMCQPRGEVYGRSDEIRFGDSVSSVTVADLLIETDRLTD